MKIKKDNKVLTIEHSEYPESPREWDNLGTMVCFHRRYNLGDDCDYKVPEDFWYDLACESLGQDKAEELFEKGAWDRYPWQRLQEAVEDSGEYVMLNLYLLDHSGLAMNTTGFYYPWDSGQVGWIYCSKERFRKETGYTEGELFSTDKHRIPIVGERVKVKDYEEKGSDGFGQVKSIDGNMLSVNFGYNKHLDARNLEDIELDDVIEVLSNRAEEVLEGEVEIYDQYLRGEIYGFMAEIETICTECGAVHSEVIDSCSGFYGRDWKNNGLLEYIPDEFIELANEL